jgi:hypothetical protein
MIQGDSFRLIMRRGPQPNQTYDLNKDIVTIGRDITNDYVINDPEVSRHHMRFTRGAEGYALEDLGSTNGTFVNGQRLSGARPLRSGDMIGLGETVTLTYEVVSAARAEDPGAAYTAPGAPRPAAPAPVQPQPGYIAPQQPGVYPPPQAQPPVPQPAAPSPYAPNYGQPGVPGQPVQPAQPAAGGYAPYSPAPAGVNPISDVGADYDPYAARAEGGSNTTRLILIGCAGLSLFCCCSTILGAVLIDQLCLWNRIPILYQVLGALGWAQVC